MCQAVCHRTVDRNSSGQKSRNLRSHTSPMYVLFCNVFKWHSVLIRGARSSLAMCVRAALCLLWLFAKQMQKKHSPEVSGQSEIVRLQYARGYVSASRNTSLKRSQTTTTNHTHTHPCNLAFTNHHWFYDVVRVVRKEGGKYVNCVCSFSLC